MDVFDIPLVPGFTDLAIVIIMVQKQGMRRPQHPGCCKKQGQQNSPETPVWELKSQM
jgi:hypothetical protein